MRSYSRHSTDCAEDRTKTKSSNRTLPLVKPFEELLLNLKEKQAINRRICGNSYCRDYLEYVYVNDMGELMKPNHITEAFPKLLERNGLRRIRFHDLRHSCASLLYANGVLLKDIQEWLGHSDIATTSNIYTHLDYSSKVASANAIIGYFPGSEEDKKDENGNAERIFLSSEMSSEKPKKPAVKAKTGAQKSKKPQEDTKKGRKTGTPVKGKK